MRRWAIAGLIALTGLVVGCSAPSKPTEAEVKSARAANPTMRNIDKARTVANDASERTDDPALH